MSTYNSFMGGVDLLDGLISYYQIFIKLKKFYLQFFFHLVNMAIISSWLLYRRDMDALAVTKKNQLDLLKFRFSVASSLCIQNKHIKKKRG